jgi:FHS family L-fucose permease-like MFS transporter
MALPQNTSSTSTNASFEKGNYLFPFILITSLFFLWGFAHNLDPILIPHLKKSFTLSTLQASLVDSAVFVAYFFMALPAGFIMKKYGYKSGIIIGLLLFATGSFLFIPAANSQAYIFFLGALFVIACGLTILETAANPYAALLGDPKTSSQRLNFAQSFNGLAATLAPIIGAKLILTKGHTDQELNAMTEIAKKAALASEASSVIMPYFILASIILLIAVAFYFTKLPEIKDGDGEASSKNIFHAFKHSHLSWGVASQFFYVGAQVCVFSFFMLFATKTIPAGTPKDGLIIAYESLFKFLHIIDKVSENDYMSYYLSIAGLAFMIGRFFGTFLMKFVTPNNLLGIYSVINIGLCFVAMNGHGTTPIYAVIGIAFFMSIMFPTIFSLGIKDLGGDTKFGSSLIIMSIVGGALLPPLFAYISDSTGNIQIGYLVPMVSFLVIMLFGFKGYKVKKVV